MTQVGIELLLRHLWSSMTWTNTENVTREDLVLVYHYGMTVRPPHVVGHRPTSTNTRHCVYVMTSPTV